jgi:hypothetical protein
MAAEQSVLSELLLMAYKVKTLTYDNVKEFAHV